MTSRIAPLAMVAFLVASAAYGQVSPGPTAATPPGTPASDKTDTIAVAPPGTVWTSLPAAQFQDSASTMVGRFIETYGTVNALLLLSRTSRFNSTGWLRDADNSELATLLFDQLSDYYLDWMRHNQCNHPACDHAYVRGQIVLDGRRPVLRVYEISFESRTGPTARVVTVAPANGPSKPLLPSQGVPLEYNTTKCRSCPTAPATPDSTTAPRKGLFGRLRQVAAVLAQKPDDAGAAGTAGGAGKFHYGREALTRTYYRNVRDTELNHVFDAWPYNLASNRWPRVVLIIEEEPAHRMQMDYGDPAHEYVDACWRIRARIWTGPATSQDVAPFNWCMSESKLDTAFADVELWGGTPKTSFTDQNTGARRTLGPNPPYLPIPEHFVSLSGNELTMLGSIMIDMGFSYAESDGRVWILREQPTAGSTR